ncbi:hypothetical protein EDD85DRAFT_795444 [Armillaria nabsnona]|nr:hypothetical protein EDD85DRAFT_795444 [Armillaria nabsnona]
MFQYHSPYAHGKTLPPPTSPEVPSNSSTGALSRLPTIHFPSALGQGRFHARGDLRLPGASTGLCDLSESANELGPPRLSRYVHRQDFISKERIGSAQSEIAPTKINGRNLSLEYPPVQSRQDGLKRARRALEAGGCVSKRQKAAEIITRIRAETASSRIANNAVMGFGFGCKALEVLSGEVPIWGKDIMFSMFFGKTSLARENEGLSSAFHPVGSTEKRTTCSNIGQFADGTSNLYEMANMDLEMSSIGIRLTFGVYRARTPDLLVSLLVRSTLRHPYAREFSDRCCVKLADFG